MTGSTTGEGQDWALEDLEEYFVKLSRLFTKDLNLQDDLMQEMRLAAWAARGEGESKQIAMRRARKAARNYEGHFSHRRRKHREIPIGGMKELEGVEAVGRKAHCRDDEFDEDDDGSEWS